MPVVTPERQKVETAAFYCFENGGEVGGHDQCDWFQGEHLVFLAENYDVVMNDNYNSRPATPRMLDPI